MLTLSSKPINSAIELIYINAIIIIIVPMEPYKALYLPKLFTNNENANDAAKLNVVARIVPGDVNAHLSFIAGAYLKINPMIL